MRRNVSDTSENQATVLRPAVPSRVDFCTSGVGDCVYGAICDFSRVPSGNVPCYRDALELRDRFFDRFDARRVRERERERESFHFRFKSARVARDSSGPGKGRFRRKKVRGK